MIDSCTSDEMLEAIMISLFTDARATDEEFEEISNWESSKRGYWADQLEGTNSGSKLWLLKRSPRDNETLEKAEIYSKEALEWMIKDNLVKQIDSSATWDQEDLIIEILLDRNKKHLLRYKR